MATQPLDQPGRCPVQSVLSAMDSEPALEAVTIDRSGENIDVATLGVAPSGTAARLAAQLHARGSDGRPCELLTGGDDCRACPEPWRPAAGKRISIQHEGLRTTIARVTCPTAPKFWRWRSFRFPKVIPREVELPGEEHPDEWKWQLLAAGLCGALGLAGVLTRGTPWSLPLFLASYLAGSWFTAQEVWERLREAVIDVHFLMLAVAVGSASIGGWGEGATLLFLFSLSGGLEHFAMHRTRREISSLFKAAPKTAIVMTAEGDRETPVEELQPGMRILVKPGAQFPVDAEVCRGATAADESNLTGEATPVEKAVGDLVLAGTLNLWGAVEGEVVRPASESALQKIVRLIEDAQQQKAPAQRFIDRYSGGYTYAVLGLCLVMYFVWWLGLGLAPFRSGTGESSAFYRTMTLLVVSSPCALVLSIPSAVLAAIASGARRGMLFRGGAAVEKLAEIDTVALDKTGTLTTGELKVEAVESFPPGREAEVAQLAYSMERLSTHPLARAITRYGKQKGLREVAFDHFESVTGQGLRARRGAEDLFLGRRDGIPADRLPPETGSSETLQRAEVWLSAGELIGRLILRDDIRPEAAGVLRHLHAAGLKTLVLTGDRQVAADHLKAELPVDDVRGGLAPEEKVRVIQELSAAGRRVAMVGDGVNDAPSLAAAHVGVAMGARGSDAALEQAELVLMNDRLENFSAAYQLSKRATRLIRQNQVISLGTVAVLATFALAGSIPLTLGVVGHEGSTVLVVMNSLRLLWVRKLENAEAPSA